MSLMNMLRGSAKKEEPEHGVSKISLGVAKAPINKQDGFISLKDLTAVDHEIKHTPFTETSPVAHILDDVVVNSIAQLGCALEDMQLIPMDREIVSLEKDATEKSIIFFKVGAYHYLLLTREGERHPLISRYAEKLETIHVKNNQHFSRRTAEASIITLINGHFVYERSRETKTTHSDSDALKRFDDIVQRAVDRGASDIHLCARKEGSAVLFRVEGVIEKQEDLKIAFHEMTAIIQAAYNTQSEKGANSGSLLTLTAMQRTSITRMVDVKDSLGKDTTTSIKLRFQTLPAINGGIDAVMRILWESGNVLTTKSDSIEDDLLKLGYTHDQAKIMSLVSRKTDGGIIFSGMVGSGKTTTLYSLLQHIAKKERKVYSIEDPVEIRQYNITQTQVETTHEKTADEATAEIVKALLRLDPDVAMVSEIRGSETASAFEQLIQTGHLSLSTVHCNSALNVYQRLSEAEIGISRDVLTTPGFLLLIVYQKLVRKLCPHCKIPASKFYRKERLEVFSQLVPTEKIHAWNRSGCKHCENNPVKGVSGRTVVAEMVLPNDELLCLIREGKSIEARALWRQNRTGLDHPSTQGKEAIEVALYKMAMGEVAPEEIEDNFEPLELYLMRQN